jgi:hypothetical protein
MRRHSFAAEVLATVVCFLIVALMLLGAWLFKHGFWYWFELCLACLWAFRVLKHGELAYEALRDGVEP